MIDRLIGRPLHYAWLIVIVTFVTLITTAGFRATPSVLIIPMQQEFGWSRATISVGISLGLLMFGLTAPFSAALMESFGMRRVILVALATIAGGRGAHDPGDRSRGSSTSSGASSSAERRAPSRCRSPRPSRTAGSTAAAGSSPAS